jgi:hypothetical protein
MEGAIVGDGREKETLPVSACGALASVGLIIILPILT